MGQYIQRSIDKYLIEWKEEALHKPLLLRGARQVGKSSAVRNLGKSFKYFAELNFEKKKGAKVFFQGDIEVRLIVSKLSNYLNVPIVPNETLLLRLPRSHHGAAFLQRRLS